MPAPLISVVIPLYNKENFIKHAVDSVIDQTFEDFEIIVVNDGSTDASVQKVKEIKDDRISILNQENKGVSTARNNGIKFSKGEWIAFLDADDWWDKTFLEELINLTTGFPENEIFATGRSMVFKNKIDIYNNKYLPAPGQVGLLDYYKVISKHLPPLHSSSTLIKKRVLINEEGPFNADQKLHEDHDLWMRLCKNRLIVFINKNLSFYRKTEVQRASANYYNPIDFLNYLKTIQKVKKQLQREQAKYFSKYYNKFILLVIIKYQSNYTRQEKLVVYKKSKGIVNNKYRFLLSLLQIPIFENIYNIKKKLKKGMFEINNS